MGCEKPANGTSQPTSGAHLFVFIFIFIFIYIYLYFNFFYFNFFNLKRKFSSLFYPFSFSPFY